MLGIARPLPVEDIVLVVATAKCPKTSADEYGKKFVEDNWCIAWKSSRYGAISDVDRFESGPREAF